ncbi:PT domain-containing protein [Streptomyces sp. NPDC003077]|uniref:PT domain-containing protein n=1 Tax=Streptomyces sp. NPDC003077 TaxID=3154443 RepID=UPI0033A29DE0
MTRPTDRPADRPTGRPTDRPTGRPTDRPTDRPAVPHSPHRRNAQGPAYEPEGATRRRCARLARPGVRESRDADAAGAGPARSPSGARPPPPAAAVPRR